MRNFFIASLNLNNPSIKKCLRYLLVAAFLFTGFLQAEIVHASAALDLKPGGTNSCNTSNTGVSSFSKSAGDIPRRSFALKLAMSSPLLPTIATPETWDFDLSTRIKCEPSKA